MHRCKQTWCSHPAAVHLQPLVALRQICRLADVQHLHQLRHEVGKAALELQLEHDVHRWAEGLVRVRALLVARFAQSGEARLYMQLPAGCAGAAAHLGQRHPANMRFIVLDSFGGWLQLWTDNSDAGET